MMDRPKHPLIAERRLARVSIDPRFLGELLGAWFRGEVVVNGRRSFLEGLPEDAVFGEAAMNPITWTLDVVIASRELEPVGMGEALPCLTLTQFVQEPA